MNTLTSFGTWLKLRRRACDLTQAQLAALVYCAEITIRKIEADQLRPSRELAALILNALEVAPTEQSGVVHLARQGQVLKDRYE
jgi:transcriptional regulator with XRE-family HTH domain